MAFPNLYEKFPSGAAGGAQVGQIAIQKYRAEQQAAAQRRANDLRREQLLFAREENKRLERAKLEIEREKKKAEMEARTAATKAVGGVPLVQPRTPATVPGGGGGAGQPLVAPQQAQQPASPYGFSPGASQQGIAGGAAIGAEFQDPQPAPMAPYAGGAPQVPGVPALPSAADALANPAAPVQPPVQGQPAAPAPPAAPTAPAPPAAPQAQPNAVLRKATPAQRSVFAATRSKLADAVKEARAQAVSMAARFDRMTELRGTQRPGTPVDSRISVTQQGTAKDAAIAAQEAYAAAQAAEQTGIDAALSEMRVEQEDADKADEINDFLNAATSEDDLDKRAKIALNKYTSAEDRKLVDDAYDAKSGADTRGIKRDVEKQSKRVRGSLMKHVSRFKNAFPVLKRRDPVAVQKWSEIQDDILQDFEAGLRKSKSPQEAAMWQDQLEDALEQLGEQPKILFSVETIPGAMKAWRDAVAFNETRGKGVTSKPDIIHMLAFVKARMRNGTLISDEDRAAGGTPELVYRAIEGKYRMQLSWSEALMAE